MQTVLAPDIAERLANVAQYVSGVGMVAVVAILWRTSERIKGIEVVLNHPRIGLVEAVSVVRERMHGANEKLQAHEGKHEMTEHRLARMDNDIDEVRLNRMIRTRDSGQQS